VLILFNCRMSSVVANQVLQRPEPLLTVARCVVLAVLAGDLVVEDSELLVQEGEDIASRVTLACSHEIGTWLGHGM